MLNKLADGIITIDKFLDKEQRLEFVAMSESVGYKPVDADMHGERKMFTVIKNIDLSAFWLLLNPVSSWILLSISTVGSVITLRAVTEVDNGLPVVITKAANKSRFWSQTLA